VACCCWDTALGAAQSLQDAAHARILCHQRLARRCQHALVALWRLACSSLLLDAAAAQISGGCPELVVSWGPGVMPAACCSDRSRMSAARRRDTHRALARLGCCPAWSCARCLELVGLASEYSDKGAQLSIVCWISCSSPSCSIAVSCTHAIYSRIMACAMQLKFFLIISSAAECLSVRVYVQHLLLFNIRPWPVA